MSAILSRWLSPIVTKAPSKNFRAKLSGDDTDDAVELAGFSTPTATELNGITGKRFDCLLQTDSHSSNQDVTSDHLSVRLSSTAQHPLPDGPANTECRSQGANSAPTGPLGPDVQLTQGHWQQTTPDIRLVMSVLLELADGLQPADQQASLQLQQLLRGSSSWEEACQHCRNGMLLCSLLFRYFAVPTATPQHQPTLTESKTSIDSSSRPDKITDSCSSNYLDSDDSIHLADNQSNRQGPAEQHFVDPLQDLREQPARSNKPLASQQLQPGLRVAKTSALQQQQEPVWLSRAQDCWLAAAAAGWILPQHCSPDCVATGDSDSVLQLFVSVIIAGESMRILQQSSCVEVLQQLHQLQQQPYGSPSSCANTHVQASGTAACCSSQDEGQCHGGNCSSPSSGSMHLQESRQELLQQKQLQQKQQQQQHLELSKIGIWPLVRTWLDLIEGLRSGLPQQLLHTKQPQQQYWGQPEQQLGLAAAARGSMTWADLLAVVSHLQHQHSTEAGAAALDSATKAQQPLPEAAAQGEDSTKGDSSSNPCSTGDSLSGAPLLLQHLGRWGCAMPLLQELDLLDHTLQGDDCPHPMQLVVLLRLLGCTSSLWLPAAAATVAARHAAADRIQRQQDGADSDSVESPRTPRAGQSPVIDGTDDVTTSPKSCWPPELLTQSQLWPGDADEADTIVMSREERTLRCWINSLLRHSERGAGSSATAGRRRQTAPGRQCSNLSTASVVLNPRDSSDLNSLDLQEFAVGCSDHPLAAASSTAAAAPVLQPTAGAEQGLHMSASSKDTRAAMKPPPVAASERDGRDSSSTDMLPGSNGGSGPTAASNFNFRCISSLCGAEVRSGVLLLELLEHLQPGCVDWKVANKLPFKGVGISPQLQALENCQLVLRIAQDQLGLPLVSMSPRDVVLGRRKIILSLVYQLMRYHTMQLLEGIAAAQQQQQSSSTVSGGTQQQFTAALAPQASVGSDSSSPTESPSETPRAAHLVKICSSSKKQRKGRQLAVSEEDILAWANRRLQQVQPLHVQIPLSSSCNGGTQSDTGSSHLQQQQGVVVLCIRSFKDPALSSGVVLLQLLHAMDPAAVDLSYVAPGATAEQRESNAKYALNVADRMGCSLFLIWEDLVDLQPNMMLVLLASLMNLDLRQGDRNTSMS